MLHEFKVSKVALRDLLLHTVADDLRRHNETAHFLAPDYLPPNAKAIPQHATMWEATESGFIDDYAQPTPKRLRRRAAHKLSALRHRCRSQLQKHVTSFLIPDELRITAALALASADTRTLCYLVLICDDHMWWSRDTQKQWLDQSGLAMQQRKDNAKRENRRDGDDDILIVSGATGQSGAPDPRQPLSHEVAQAGNLPGQNVDIRGWHRPTSYSRKRRLAYCSSCSDAMARRYLFQTFAKRGNAKCDICAAPETLGTDDQFMRTLGSLVVERRVKRGGVLLTEQQHYEQSALGGWIATIRQLLDGTTVVEELAIHQLVPTQGAATLQRLFRRQK